MQPNNEPINLINKFDKEVRNFFEKNFKKDTEQVLEILANPDRVQVAQVKAESITKFGEYPIESERGVLKDQQIAKFKQLLFSKNSYMFGVEKRCSFYPQVALKFIKNKAEIKNKVDVFLSFSCNMWLFVYNNKAALEDFDSIEKDLSNFFFTNSTP